jgi:hypothetical protein
VPFDAVLAEFAAGASALLIFVKAVPQRMWVLGEAESLVAVTNPPTANVLDDYDFDGEFLKVSVITDSGWGDLLGHLNAVR